jgi:non-ribosomal peptide synthetase component F
VKLNCLPDHSNTILRKFDLNFSLTATEDGLRGSVQYCTDLFNQDTIDRLLTHFDNLLKSIVLAPQQKIALLPMLGDSEKQQLLEVFNHKPFEFPAEINIVSLLKSKLLNLHKQLHWFLVKSS